MRIENYTIGSDPELFIYDFKNERFVSSIGLIPGVKGEAAPMGDLGEGYGLQIDNVLAEFNIPPTNNRKLFVEYINKAKSYIEDYVKSVDPNLGIICEASAYFPEDQLQSDEAKLFGCSVDYNAWTSEPNEKPDGETTNLRTTGTHVHIGYDDNRTQLSLEIVRTLDLFLGVPSVLIDPDTVRRKLYGKAGAFRLTNYGVEYRTLSGYFIKNSQLMAWLYDQTIEAINYINNGNTVTVEGNKDIVKCINNCDKKLAEKICSTYNLNLIN